eukprot:2288625-Pyramimonas_sp.AAC.1
MTRLRYELAFEQHKQPHLQKIGHKSYNAEILKRVTKRLHTFQVKQTTSPARGSARAGARASASPIGGSRPSARTRTSSPGPRRT